MKSSVSKLLIALAALASAALVHAAPSPVEKLLASAERNIESAGQQNTFVFLEQGELELDKVLVVEPKNALAWYYKGLSAYTRSTLEASTGDAGAREAALTQADKALRRSLELKRDGEALALHATVLSMLVGLRGAEAGAELGAQAFKALAEARRLEPDSPRVLIQAGIAAFYTPKEWGGDVGEAAKLFERAVQAYEGKQDADGLPRWGRAESHVWLGQARQKLGENAQAKVEFEKALAISPDYAWVNYVLLPGVLNAGK